MSVDRSYVERNAASRHRLHALSPRLGDPDFTRAAEGGWTVGALLAHLAFWDRFVVERLMRWEKSGFDSSVVDADVINGAAIRGWRAIPGRAALHEALDAAEECDRRLERVADEIVTAILAAGRHRMLDRSLHRDEHIREVERLLA